MRIIGKIISCVLVALLYAPNASAFLNSTHSAQTNLFHIVPPIDRTQNQNPNKSRPQAPALVLPETGSVSHYPKEAKVHFIVDTADKIGFDNINQNFDHNNANRCKNLGFTKTTACGANENKGRTCPYDDSYFDKCCDKNYAYGKSECSYPNTISTASCNSKYKCYCDRTLYPHTSCAAPKITGSDKCAEINYANGKATTTVYYSTCQCPSGYRTCGTNQVGLNTNGTDGGACNEDGQNKYAGCRCKDGYSLTCSDYGPKNSSDFCMIGTKYYKECKTINDVCAEELKNKYPPYNVTQGDCAAFENQLATCSKDSSFKVCQPTCKSKVAANSEYAVDANGVVYSLAQPYTAFVFEDTDTIPLINATTGNKFTLIKGAYYVKNISLCNYIPTLTARTIQDNYVLSRTFEDVNIKFNDTKYYFDAAFSNNDRIGYSGRTNVEFYFDRVAAILRPNLTSAADITIYANNNSNITLYSNKESTRTLSIEATNNSKVELYENTKLNTLSLRSGSTVKVDKDSFYNEISRPIDHTISSLTVDGSGSKFELINSKKLNISTATVSNYGVIQADGSNDSSRTYAISTLNANNYGVFKTNYIKPFTIGTLNISNRGMIKVGTMGAVKVTGNINFNSCARMCTYGQGDYNKGAFYYKNSVSQCGSGSNGCTIFYSGTNYSPMSEDRFNYAKCHTSKYLGDRWLSKNGGARCLEMCGSSYSVDTITNEHC